MNSIRQIVIITQQFRNIAGAIDDLGVVLKLNPVEKQAVSDMDYKFTINWATGMGCKLWS